MSAIAWLIALIEETEKARRGFMRSTISFSSALGLAMMVLNEGNELWEHKRAHVTHNDSIYVRVD